MQSIRSRMQLARRRDRPSSFFLTVGSVDAVIGGVSSHGSLLVIGLAVMGVGAVLRWRKLSAQPKPVGTPHLLPSPPESLES